ncbi:MAG: cation:proton antiporter [Wenzhouxiangellaceae bacterium]
MALTFSSTIIIVRLLSDKREIESLHGQIALGFLTVQDLVVVFAMVVLSTMGMDGGGASDAKHIGPVLTTAFGMLLIVVFVCYLGDVLTARLARSPELMPVSAIGLAAIFIARPMPLVSARSGRSDGRRGAGVDAVSGIHPLAAGATT